MRKKEGRYVFDINFLCQYIKRRTEEEEALQATKDAAMEEHLVAIYFLDQYHSQRCWANVIVAQFLFDQLASKTAQLEAVKEQILITAGLAIRNGHTKN